tara:strand:+ start:4523 stop:4654 length:132 start_codon:yes stop_codon:yes gene_type:complete
MYNSIEQEKKINDTINGKDKERKKKLKNEKQIFYVKKIKKKSK